MAIGRVTLSAPVRDDFNLSFNDIIAHTPGREGRGDAKPGAYINRAGKVLVLLTVNPQLVPIEPRANGKKTNRTGLTRSGMFMVQKDGGMRQVTCDRSPDGEKKWKKYTGSLTITF